GSREERARLRDELRAALGLRDEAALEAEDATAPPAGWESATEADGASVLRTSRQIRRARARAASVALALLTAALALSVARSPEPVTWRPPLIVFASIDAALAALAL